MINGLMIFAEANTFFLVEDKNNIKLFERKLKWQKKMTILFTAEISLGRRQLFKLL